MLGLKLLVKSEDVIFIFFFLISIFDNSIGDGGFEPWFFLVKNNKFLTWKNDLAT